MITLKFKWLRLALVLVMACWLQLIRHSTGGQLGPATGIACTDRPDFLT